MAHKHDGELYYVIVENKTNSTLRDDWYDILTFDSEEEAQEYIDENFCEIDYHVETWLDY